MDAKEIIRLLDSKFKAHKYALANSFVYKWESDFFSITTTGYAQEVEVKISYSDFKADFKKLDKHNALISKFKGVGFRTKFLWRTYKIKSPAREVRGRVYRQREYETTESNGKRETYWRKNGFEFQWINSEVDYVTPGDCPNKFWYVCPAGVIPVEEVPEYAGLMYIDPETRRFKTIKRAPFIHKEKQDLTQILLDKFYWLSFNLKNKLNACLFRLK